MRLPLRACRIAPADSRELRRSVLRPGLAIGSTLPGDDAEGAVHIGAFSGESLLSACLILPETCPWRPSETAWRLRGMATEPAHRGTGAGAAVLLAATRIARELGARVLWCHARESAVGFYLAHGWQPIGALFDTEFGPHLQLWRDLTGPDR